ncbi:MAG: SufBD protein [Planctomycetes bacterium SM23_32]|nr:MAG: SufBD protein [Planctomycetes bacterium SM23_32]
MGTDYELMLDLYDRLGQDPAVFADSEVAHLVIHQNKVIGANLVEGFGVEPEELDDGVRVRVWVEDGAVIERTVHMCFGVLPEKGLQRILLDVDVGAQAKVALLAHCVFPNAVDVTHRMQAEIRVAEGGDYAYFERHVHGRQGGVLVVPEARVRLEAGARFETEFELLAGRVGRIKIDYETWCAERSAMRMIARVAGRGDDRIEVRETAHLTGEGATGVLLSRIAVQDQARAEVYNRLTASAPRARGHVDCKEIVRGNAVACATPIVSVEHPLAHVTHEAAIGSVDSKQLQTLMARGVTEEEAVEIIIQGLLAPKDGGAPP